ncbi:MAG: hypothetical protein AAF564_02025 [Bacteroidota bacterium]
MPSVQTRAQQRTHAVSSYTIAPLSSLKPNPRNPKLALGISLFNSVTPFLVNNLILRDRRKHESTRLLLSAYGLLLGPSTGYIYGRHYGRAVGGFMVRTLGIGVSFLAIGIVVNDTFFRGGEGNNVLPAILFYGGLGFSVYSGISDFFRIQRVIAARNELLASKHRVSMAPVYAGKQYGYGFALRVQY